MNEKLRKSVDLRQRAERRQKERKPSARQLHLEADAAKARARFEMLQEDRRKGRRGKGSGGYHGKHRREDRT